MNTQLDLPGVPALPPPSPAWPTNHVRVAWVGEKMPAAHCADPVTSSAYWFTNVSAHPFFDPQKEHLAVLLLNTKMKCFAWNLVSVGILDQTLAHPREVLRPAVAAAAYGFVVMHNHPSGDTGPSEADRRLTTRINEAARLLQIQLIDHIIVGARRDDPRFSFREHGLC